MQHQTAWTRRTPASSLPSDRIRPAQLPASTAKGKGKGGAATLPAEPPKSRAVRELETLIAGLTASSSGAPATQGPKGGCFCQACTHALSPHSPLCRTCGLILCTLNAPYHTCPSCTAGLLTDSQRLALLGRLHTQLGDTLAKEERDRIQALEDARRAAGAFPTLTSRPHSPALSAPAPEPKTRTVMSLSKSGRVKVSAFNTVPKSQPHSAASSRPASPEPVRIPPPPDEVSYISDARIDAARPYRDLVGDGAVYFPAPDLDDGEGDVREGGEGAPGGGGRRKQTRSRGNKKGKGKEKGADASATATAVGVSGSGS